MQPLYKGPLMSIFFFLCWIWIGGQQVKAQNCTPEITASAASLCSSGTVTLSASQAASYEWSTGATTQTIAVIQPGAYWVKTKTADGCEGTSATYNVTGAPDASISNPIYNFTYCSYSGSSAAFKLSVNNTSTTRDTNQEYVINWGDGTSDTFGNSFASTTHTYKTAGSFDLLLTVTGPGGCTTSKTERVFIGSNPGLGISSKGNSTNCAPATFNFTITGTTGNSPYTIYTFQFDDGTLAQRFTQAELERLPRDPATNEVILTHTFTESSEGKQNGFTLSGTAENPCSSSKATFEGIRISKGPVADFGTGTGSSTGCVNVPILFTDMSKGGYDASTRTDVYNRNWDISPATGWVIAEGTLEDPRPSITFTQPGDYTMTLTVSPLDPNSTCSGSSKDMIISIMEPPTADFTLTGDGTCAPATFTTQNLSTGEDLHYTWQVTPATGWRFAEGSDAASAAPGFVFSEAGSYVVSLVTGNNCSPDSRKEIPVVIQDNPVATLPEAATYCGPQTITFSADNAAHAPTYEAKQGTISKYSWLVNGPAGGAVFAAGSDASSAYPTIDFTLPGQYTVQVVATNGCGDSEPATQVVTINPLPELTVNPSQAAICLGESTELAVSGADTYTWTPADGLSATTGSTVTASPTATTTYTITGTTSATGCSSSTTVTIVVNNPPKVQVTADVPEICLGQAEATLTASGADSYTWAPTTGLSSTSGASVIATPSETTTYTVTGYTDATGCSATATVTVTVNPLPEVNAGEDLTVCNKPVPTTLAASPAGGVWSGEHVTESGIFTPPSQTGTYELTYTYTNGKGCSNFDKRVVTVEEAPVAEAGPDQVVCLNSGLFKLQAFPAGGTWTGEHVGQDGTFTPSAAGSFNLTYTFGSGSCETSDQVQVTVNALPEAPIVAATQTLCPGFGTSLQVTDPQGHIAWYDAPTGGTLLHEGDTFDTPTLDKTTTYYVETSIEGGCTSTRRAITVAVHPATPAPVVDPVQLCGPGNTATLVANGTATSYEWYDAPTGGTLLSQERAFTTDPLDASRSYYVQAILNGCVSPRTEAKVNVYPVLTQGPLQEVPVICAGQQPETLTSTAPAGGDGSYTYQWESSITGATTGFTNIEGATNAAYTSGPLNRTTWFRRTVRSASCVSTSEVLQVQVTPVTSNNTIRLTNESALCEGSEGGEISGSKPEGGSGTYTYRWEISTTGAEGVYSNAPGDNSGQSYSPGTLTQTTWFRRVVDSGTCQQHFSQPVRIVVYKPIVHNSISGAQTVCSGSAPSVLQGSQPAEGDGDYTYAWEMSTDQGATYSSATGQNNALSYDPGPLTTTTWFRRVVSGGPCGSNTSNTVIITVNPVIGNNTITPVSPICSGQEAPLLAGPVLNGGDGSYTYQWLYSTGGANGTFTSAPGTATEATYAPGVLTQTTWYKRVVRSGECASTSPVVQVTVNQLPQAPTVQPVTICENTTATLTVQEQTGTYKWYTSEEATTAVFTGRTFTTPSPLSASTTFYVEAVNSSGCGSAVRVPVQVTVNQNINHNTLTAPTPQPLCAGQTPAAITGSAPENGNGTYTYRWESSETGPDSGFKTIAGATSMQYQPAALRTTTWFRRIVVSAPCFENYSEAVKIDVVPVVSGNTIRAAQTLCYGDIPATLTGATPTGGDGTYTYLWESSTDGSTYTSAAGDNASINYTAPVPLTQTLWYRRVVFSGPCSRDESAPVKVTVQPALVNNTLTTPEQTICAGESPALITGLKPTGGDNNPVYVWESSTDGVTFAPAAGTRTNQNYQPQPLEQTTWFRRKVTAGACYTYSEPVKVTVNPVLKENSITESQEICTGSAPASLTGSAPTGGNGSYTYQWQYSETGTTGSFKAVAGNGQQQHYAPGTLSNTTWFRRVVTSGACSSISNEVRIDVSPEIAKNTIVLSQTIYAGEVPAPLTGSTPIGGNGSFTYVWEQSVDGSTYTAAPAPNTGKNYLPQALKKDTWYRRVVYSGGCSNTSVPVKITVTPAIGTNNIQADQIICYNNQPATLTGTKPMGGEGDYKFIWQSSTLGPETGWVTAKGTSTGQNYSPQPLTQTTWFRRIVISGTNTDTSVPVMITVKPAMRNNKISTSQTICYNSAPATLSGSVPTGGSGSYTYLWELSTDGTNYKTAPGDNNRQDYNPPPLTRTTWFRRVVTSESCEGLVSEPVQVTILPLPAAPLVADASICAGTTATLTATGKGGRLEWYASASGGTLLKVGATYTTPVLQHTTSYYVQEVSQTCAGERTKVTVRVAEASANAGDDVSVVKGRSAELHASGGVSYSWSPAAGMSNTTIANPVATPEVTTTYKVTVVTDGGCTFTDEVTVTVLPFVDIPNTFTPNRDGINDTWEIANIDKYPNCTVQVFNQWGNEVFRSEGYGESWDGRYKGQELPIATYYYVIHLDKTEKPLAGSITIVR